MKTQNQVLVSYEQSSRYIIIGSVLLTLLLGIIGAIYTPVKMRMLYEIVIGLCGIAIILLWVFRYTKLREYMFEDIKAFFQEKVNLLKDRLPSKVEYKEWEYEYSTIISAQSKRLDRVRKSLWEIYVPVISAMERTIFPFPEGELSLWDIVGANYIIAGERRFISYLKYMPKDDFIKLILPERTVFSKNEFECMQSRVPEIGNGKELVAAMVEKKVDLVCANEVLTQMMEKSYESYLLAYCIKCRSNELLFKDHPDTISVRKQVFDWIITQQLVEVKTFDYWPMFTQAEVKKVKKILGEYGMQIFKSKKIWNLVPSYQLAEKFYLLSSDVNKNAGEMIEIASEFFVRKGFQPRV